MDEILDRIKFKIKTFKVKRKHLVVSLLATEILGILVFLWILRVPIAQKFFTSPQKAYSVVSLNPQKRYLVSQGDLLTGKAIPGTSVKILITPEFIKNTITADSKGDWWYQVPADLQTNVHRFTFGNFDKNNKLVTFQTYKFRVQSNISLFNLTDSIRRRISNLFRPANAQMRTGFIPDLYVNTGLPSPHIPITLTEEQRNRFRNYFLPYAYTAAKITGADWRLMAMFVHKENHIYNYFDNCLDNDKDYGPDADYDPNTPCTGWGIPQWQVGWGIYPPQWANEKLPEAIAVMKPGKTIQEIGQEVIDNSYDQSRYAIFDHEHELDPITYPDRFPDNVTLDEIIEESQPILNDGLKQKPSPEEKNLVIGTKTCRPFIDANTDPRQDPKDCYMRQLLGILMKDPAISAYLLASMWKDRYDEQQVINEIKYQWGEGFDLQIASNMIAGFDNEAEGIDFEALTTTPQIIIPVATYDQDPVYPIDGVQVESVVSQNGSALDEQDLNNRNLKREYQVIPYGSSPNDFKQPDPINNVRGISNIDEVSVEPEAAANPSDYQLCALLKPIDFEVVIDEDCVPLDQVINPQIPADPESASATIAASCPLIPENGEFECTEGICKSTEYDCSSGRRWYFDEYKNPQNSCEFEAKSNTDGEFAGLWYHGDIDPSCSEEPVQEPAAEFQTYDIPASYDPDHVDEPIARPEIPQQEPEQPAPESENPSLDQTIEFEGN